MKIFMTMEIYIKRFTIANLAILIKVFLDIFLSCSNSNTTNKYF